MKDCPYHRVKLIQRHVKALQREARTLQGVRKTRTRQLKQLRQDKRVNFGSQISKVAEIPVETELESETARSNSASDTNDFLNDIDYYDSDYEPSSSSSDTFSDHEEDDWEKIEYDI